MHLFKYFFSLILVASTLISASDSRPYMTPIINYILSDSSEQNLANAYPFVNEFNVGFGGSSAFPFKSITEGETIWVSAINLAMDNNIEDDIYYGDIKDFNSSAFSKLQDNLKHSKFIVFWFVEGWDESWFNSSKIQVAMDAGYVPVFNYWHFGDKLMQGIPDSAKKEAYAIDNVKVANFLNELNGTKILIMEPEFNKNVILESEENQHLFASILGSAIDVVKANCSDILFSLAMTDTGNRGVNSIYEKCGYENCSLGDKYEWGRPKIIYDDLLDKLDFISFQEMVGEFSRDPSNPGDWENPNPKIYTDDEIGIDFLAQRISNFSAFLNATYNKPVFLPYVAIATATWNDSNANNVIEDSEINHDGWVSKANATYQNLNEMKQTLKDNGLFGYATMELFDNPRHDYGGYQYFMNNEYHLGIVGSGAIDESDAVADGSLYFKGDILEAIFGVTTP